MKQKIKDDKKRITVLPVLCCDPDFDFPLQIISKLLGTKWKGGFFEEIEIGDVKLKRKNFGDYKENYLNIKAPSFFNSMLNPMLRLSEFPFNHYFNPQSIFCNS